MKKSRILSLLVFSTLLAGNSFANTEKMTYEKAMESDKNTFHRNSVPLQETIDNWNTYVKAPNESSGGSSEKYVVLFKGNCTLGTTCTLAENINNYAAVIVGANNQHARLNTAVFPTDGLVGRELNMATNTSGDGNDLIHLKFTSRTTLQYVGAAYTGIITNVWGMNKQPPEPTECSAGQVQREDIYCASPQRTCETGSRLKTCNSGFWSPSSTTRNPICVSQNRQCP